MAPKPGSETGAPESHKAVISEKLACCRGRNDSKINRSETIDGIGYTKNYSMLIFSPEKDGCKSRRAEKQK